MNATVISTNIAHPRPDPAGREWHTGIDKRPVDHIEVFAPGPNYGDGSGVVGDHVGASKFHGGANKAVYAFAREELDYWQEATGKVLPNGSFGENLSTLGIHWPTVHLNQRIQVGSAVLEVSVARRPCATFAAWLGEEKWVKRFFAHGDCGAYLRVIEPGVISPGDEVTFGPVLTDTMTMAEAFAAKLDAVRKA